MKRITSEQWKAIDAPILERMECGCNPVCQECFEAMLTSQRLHTYYSKYNNPVTPPIRIKNSSSPTSSSKTMMWYEVTFTYPGKNIEDAKESIERLKKYSEYKYIDGRFEIGKNGLYHIHFLIKTHKYLRLREIKACNKKKVCHLSRLKGKDGLKFQNYIEKAVDDDVPEPWKALSFSL